MPIRSYFLTALMLTTTFALADQPTETKAKKDYIQQVTYGGDSGAEIFKIRSEDAVKWAVETSLSYIQKSKTENKPLHTFYTEFLGEKETGLAKFRRDIAFETNTGAKEAFGALRNNDTGHLLDYTPIRKSWHDDVTDYFGNLLNHLERTDMDHIVHLNSPRGQNNLYILQQEYCLDDRNIAHSRELLINHYKHNPADLTDENVLKMAQHESVSLDELFFGPPSGELKRDLRMMQRQKDALRVVKYEVKIKVGDKLVPASVIYGYFQADTNKLHGVSKDSIERLRNKSHYIVMHAAKDHVPTLMAEVEKYWEKALQREHSDVRGIKDDMANLFYIQTHAMPYSRGSEAMTKWIVEAIARVHGWTVQYPEEYGFQDPFQLTIDDFVNEFHTKVKLVPYVLRTEAQAAGQTVSAPSQQEEQPSPTLSAQTSQDGKGEQPSTHQPQTDPQQPSSQPAIITITVPAVAPAA